MPIAPLRETSASIYLLIRYREGERSAGGELAVHARRRLAAPDRTADALELTRQLQLVAGLDDALEAHVVYAGEQGQLAAVRLVGKDGHRPRLRHRLHDQNAGHDRPAREVPRQVPLVVADELAGHRSHARLELDYLVEQQEGVAVREDFFDPRTVEHCLHPRAISSRCAFT